MGYYSKVAAQNMQCSSQPKSKIDSMFLSLLKQGNTLHTMHSGLRLGHVSGVFFLIFLIPC